MLEYLDSFESYHNNINIWVYGVLGGGGGGGGGGGNTVPTALRLTQHETWLYRDMKLAL